VGQEGRRLVLVKHAQPVLDPLVPPREWRLSTEGEKQARQVAERLKPFLPFALVCSREPKAVQTAEIIATAVNASYRPFDGLEEFDRPAMPIVSREEHERLNARLFVTRSVPVLGRESAVAALARFDDAIRRAFAATPPTDDLVVIAHGTVIALFTEQQTGQDAFEIWRSLQCADYLVISIRRNKRETGNGKRETGNG
jgi:broad specificity phosphatase PhoE